MSESIDLLQHNNNNPSACKICCLMCSCCNKKGFWFTKLGKFIFWLPLFILLLFVGLVLLDLVGVGTMKIVYNQYNLTTGCLINQKETEGCDMRTMCYTEDYKSLIIGCAAIGSVTFVILFISVLLIMIFIGSMFYCFDTCCSELNNSYKHSKFTIQRLQHNNRVSMVETV